MAHDLTVIPTELELDIAGLGMILYSPFAVAHIAEGADYLSSSFMEPGQVGAHVRACALTAFCTGSPGSYVLRFLTGQRDEEAVRRAEFAIRLGLEVRDDLFCVRDLYDLMEWTAACPASQRIRVPSGFYRLTLYTSMPASGWLGDEQEIYVHLEPVPGRPDIVWPGVPVLCE